jgi:hypothetical protein
MLTFYPHMKMEKGVDELLVEIRYGECGQVLVHRFPGARGRSGSVEPTGAGAADPNLAPYTAAADKPGTSLSLRFEVQLLLLASLPASLHLFKDEVEPLLAGRDRVSGHETPTTVQRN